MTHARPMDRGAESSPLGGGWRVALSFALGAAAIVAIGGAVAILAKAHVGQALLEVSWKRAQERAMLALTRGGPAATVPCESACRAGVS